ncbi:MAG: pirin family protein [Myxococcales bacterium]|nr:pirin family protein [Myxococcales bacterium]MCB9642327.1 pirin family protein [Myxococcales bacterium]
MERGGADHGWLRTKHSFSFARYYDPAHMGFRSLRVINEDHISAGGGFPMHPHKDMEIITYVLSGALEHKDSLRNGSIIRPGEVQRMTAGTGIRHSEFNPLRDRDVHLLQIWLQPDRREHKPSYEQRVIKPHTRSEPLRLIASKDGGDGAVHVNQDVNLYACRLQPGQKMEHLVRPGRGVWVQVARGTVKLNGHTLHAGDAASVEMVEGRMSFSAQQASELLLFDLG